MKSRALKNKMNGAGFGYRSCATVIKGQCEAKVHFSDVFNFVNRKQFKIGRSTKKAIRDFFISQGWIAAPKKRQAPICRRCGLKYPTRKFSNKISSRNHKRSTKLSHK